MVLAADKPHQPARWADDAQVLRDKGVAAVYTPKDFDFGRIMDELVTLVENKRARSLH